MQITATTLDTSVDFARTLNVGKTSVVPPVQSNASKATEQATRDRHVHAEPGCCDKMSTV